MNNYLKEIELKKGEKIFLYKWILFYIRSGLIFLVDDFEIVNRVVEKLNIYLSFYIIII